MCPEVTKNIYFWAKYKNKISEIITFIRSTINALLEFKRGPKEQNLHSDTFGYIINLSSRTFSYSDFQFLNKKLIFCQTGYYRKQHFQQDLQNTPYKYTIQPLDFGYSVRNKSNKGDCCKTRTKPSWVPRTVSHTVFTYIDAIWRN